MTTISANVSGASVVPSETDLTTSRRVSWAPIMMGAVTAIGMQFIFTVLGIAIGVSTRSVADETTRSTVQTISVAAGAWWLTTGTIALAAGGYVFGRLAGLFRSTALTLEAIVMWGVVALFGFMVMWSGAGMLSQAASPIALMSTSSVVPSISSLRGDASRADSSRSDLTSEQASASRGANDESKMSNTLGGRAEEARRATRTASWWSVLGLIIGMMASVGGARMGAAAIDSRNPRRFAA